MSEQQPIFPESPEAATFQTGLSGWVDRHGRFWGNDERMARYSGSTHRKCECGAVIDQKSYCHSCSRVKKNNKFNEARKLPWDEETPLYSQAYDEFFFDKDQILDFMHERAISSLDELQLFICKPNYLSQIDSDLWCEDLPGDGKLPAGVEAALDALNKVIRSAEPASWSPGNVAAIVEIEA